MKKRVARDIPLSEITLRKYEKPSNLSKRDLFKKICLSLGLLQPGDSRDIIVDILHAIHEHKKLASEEVRDIIIKARKKTNLPLVGIAPSNIRRQLKRLKDSFLIEKVQNNYRINENEHLINIFEEKIEKYYLQSILERVKEYLHAVKKK